MKPSIKTLTTRLKLTRQQAIELREAMDNNKGLYLANKMLKGFGIENIVLPEGCFDRGEKAKIEITYINMGDTYDVTLLKVNGQYRVGDWGSIVEKYS